MRIDEYKHASTPNKILTWAFKNKLEYIHRQTNPHEIHINIITYSYPSKKTGVCIRIYAHDVHVNIIIYRYGKTKMVATDEEKAEKVEKQEVVRNPNFTFNMEDVVSVCKRRGFIFQSSEIYNGFNGFYDYGPLGVEMKNNIKKVWWRDMVHRRCVFYIHARICVCVFMYVFVYDLGICMHVCELCVGPYACDVYTCKQG
jgi:hypothetical protein